MNDPYVPPAVPVGSVPGSLAPRARPTQVTVAAIILWTSIAAGCAYAFTMLTVASLPAVITVGMVLLSGWVVYEILKGRNWARIILLIVTVAGALALCTSLVLIPISSATRTSYEIRLLESALRITALVLLFVQPGRGWYKRAAPSSRDRSPAPGPTS